MEKEVVIEVKNISKKYNIFVGYEPDNLREKVLEIINYPLRAVKGLHKTKTKIFWALRDISFSVYKGQVIGIIGENGAGKSTLLKILSRITDPTMGEIRFKGKIASLLEVGTGFNPELTGRENIFLNGAIIGMKKKEIKAKIESIIDFSGVREFIDTPVKRYSSGMYVRLAFSVAAHLDTDILILDEVLAVGDAAFHRKSYEKVKSLVSEGKTVVIVSHDMSAVRELADSVIILKQGKIVAQGPTAKIVNKYIIGSDIEEAQNIFKRPKNESKSLLQKIVIESASKPTNIIEYGDKLVIKIHTKKLASPGFSIELILKNEMMERVGYISSMLSRGDSLYSAGSEITLMTESLNLAEGRYWLDINCRQYPHLHVDKWLDAGYFSVTNARPGRLGHSIKSVDGLGSWIITSSDTEKNT